MFGAKSASNRATRCVLLGLAVVSVAVMFTVDSSDARRRQRKQASAYNPPFASIMVDANSGAVLQATNADSPRHPASLTKVMTLYMLFERLDTGKLKLDSMLEVSKHAAAQAPTKLGLRAGQTIRVEDAIKGMVTRSANDAAVVVAEALAGSESNFGRMMTRKARALGMSKTVYVNASGLPDNAQITTARDQSILGRAIQDRFPRYYRYFATSSFTFRGHAIRNHNRLLGRVEGVDGIKTGYIRASGFNLLSSMRRGNRHLVGVVMGGRTGASRDATMSNLLAKNLDKAATRRTVAAITERPIANEPAETPSVPMVQVQGAIQSASADTEIIPVPAPRPELIADAAAAMPEDRQKPAPAPLTSGVIAAPIALAPGSSEPMTPVRVKTVQVRVNGAARNTTNSKPVPPAPVSTSAIVARAAETQGRPKAVENRAAEPVKIANSPPPFPAPLPIVISHNASRDIDQGSTANPPAPQFATAQTATAQTATAQTATAYADPTRGAPPTTLGAQAQALAALSAPPQQVALASSVPVPPASVPQNKTSPRSGWIIQVGALESESQARARLNAARDHASKLLNHADPFTETVSKGRKTLYRARFAGLDQSSAEAACRTLKRSDIGCIAIRN